LHPPCGHTYTAASRHLPDGRYEITGITTWDVSWTVTGGPQSGASGTITLTPQSQTTLRINELQVLDTNPYTSVTTPQRHPSDLSISRRWAERPRLPSTPRDHVGGGQARATDSGALAGVTGAGRSPTPPRYEWMAAAAARPSAIAHTMSDAPRCASPATKTPS